MSIRCGQSIAQEALKKAEKLLRQGKLDLAIAEYAAADRGAAARLEHRATRSATSTSAPASPTRPCAQYMQHRRSPHARGLLSRSAAALYKKILKIKPDEEPVQLHLGGDFREAGAARRRQGLLRRRSREAAPPARRHAPAPTRSSSVSARSIRPTSTPARWRRATLAQNGRRDRRRDAVSARCTPT